MDDEQKALIAQDRAAKADALLSDPLLQEVFAELDGELVERWRGTEDPLTRDALWQSVQIVEKLQTNLKRIARNGKVSKAILDKLGAQDSAPR